MAHWMKRWMIVVRSACITVWARRYLRTGFGRSRRLRRTRLWLRGSDEDLARERYIPELRRGRVAIHSYGRRRSRTSWWDARFVAVASHAVPSPYARSHGAMAAA